MANSSSVRLFSDFRALNRWFETLDVALHEACDAYVVSGEPMTAKDMTRALTDKFRLFPAWIDAPLDVTVHVPPTAYDMARGEKQIEVPRRAPRFVDGQQDSAADGAGAGLPLPVQAQDRQAHRQAAPTSAQP